MALQKREKTMLIGLGVVAVAAVLFQVLTGGKSKAGKDVTQIVKKTAGQVAGAVASLPKTETRGPVDTSGVRFDEWSARDPFSKPEFEMRVGNSESAPFTVKGIVWMKGKPYVLINDLILAAGDEKNGIRVERIEGRKVLCRKGGKMFSLQWSESP